MINFNDIYYYVFFILQYYESIQFDDFRKYKKSLMMNLIDSKYCKIKNIYKYINIFHYNEKCKIRNAFLIQTRIILLNHIRRRQGQPGQLTERSQRNAPHDSDETGQTDYFEIIGHYRRVQVLNQIWLFEKGNFRNWVIVVFQLERQVVDEGKHENGVRIWKCVFFSVFKIISKFKKINQKNFQNISVLRKISKLRKSKKL